MRSLKPVVAGAVALACLAAAEAATAGAKKVSSDPFTNPDSQHATQVEPDTFAFGKTVVVAFQTGRFFDGGSSGIGFATSQDRGKTWVHGFLPSLTVNSTPAGPYGRVSDPAVAYDAKHGTWMIVSLGLGGAAGTGVLISRSTDGGLTWDKPVTVSTSTGFYDKTWVACDNTKASPHHGNCYVTWDDAANASLLLTSTSSDGGKTWGTKKATADNAKGIGGQPLPQPSGDVVVPVLSAFVDKILAYKSTDGGTSWDASTVVANISDHDIAGKLRSEPLPSAEVDGAGKVYVVWHDCRFRLDCASNDIVMSTSTDGTSWTSPLRIPIDAVDSTVDHFIPGIAVDRDSAGSTARLALTYYYYPDAKCTQSTCQLSVGFVSSVDGGATWSAPLTLAGPMKLTDLADTNSGFMVGDYLSTSFSGSKAVPVFALAKPRRHSVFDEAMYASRPGVSAQQFYPLRAVAEQVLSPQGDRARRTQPLVLQ